MGWALSCHELIAPVLVPVVAAMNRPPTAAPKRTSLPSMLPIRRLVDGRREERVADVLAVHGQH